MSGSNGYLLNNLHRMNDMIFNNVFNELYDVNYANILTAELYTTIIPIYASTEASNLNLNILLMWKE